MMGGDGYVVYVTCLLCIDTWLYGCWLWWVVELFVVLGMG